MRHRPFLFLRRQFLYIVIKIMEHRSNNKNCALSQKQTRTSKMTSSEKSPIHHLIPKYTHSTHTDSLVRFLYKLYIIPTSFCYQLSQFTLCQSFILLCTVMYCHSLFNNLSPYAWRGMFHKSIFIHITFEFSTFERPSIRKIPTILFI